MVFSINMLKLIEISNKEVPERRFSLIFFETAAREPSLELTYNWDQYEPYTTGLNFGHLAYLVENIYHHCETLKQKVLRILCLLT